MRNKSNHVDIILLFTRDVTAYSVGYLVGHLAESVPEKPKRSALNQLTRTLLRKYDCGVRPVHNWSNATTVFVDFILQSVLDVVNTSLFENACVIVDNNPFFGDPEEFVF